MPPIISSIMIYPHPSLIAQIKDVQLLRSLAAYSVQRGRHAYGSHARKGFPPGYAPDDVMQEAITRTLGGERRWDPNKDPDLLKYLKDIIDSIYSKCGKTSATRMHKASVDLDATFEVGERDKEDKPRYLKGYAIIDALADGVGATAAAARGIREGLSPKETARKEGVDVEVVNNEKKRIRTILKNAFKTQKGKFIAV